MSSCQSFAFAKLECSFGKLMPKNTFTAFLYLQLSSIAPLNKAIELAVASLIYLISFQILTFSSPALSIIAKDLANHGINLLEINSLFQFIMPFIKLSANTTLHYFAPNLAIFWF